jgi:hypothetical protein
LATVKVEILSEVHVVVVSVDILAPAIEKLMQAKKIMKIANAEKTVLTSLHCSGSDNKLRKQQQKRLAER